VVLLLLGPLFGLEDQKGHCGLEVAAEGLADGSIGCEFCGKLEGFDSGGRSICGGGDVFNEFDELKAEEREM